MQTRTGVAVIDAIFKRLDLCLVFLASAFDCLFSPDRAANVITSTMLEAYINNAFPFDDETLKMLNRAHFKVYGEYSK